MRDNCKILIIDDHQILIEGLLSLLKSQKPELQLLQAASIAEARTLIAKHPDIDIVLLDLHFPGVDGLSLLKSKELPFPTIILSSTEDMTLIDSAKEHGALGFVSKGNPTNELFDAIKTVLDGETFFINNSFTSDNHSAEKQQKIDATLQELKITQQNYRVLCLLADGLSNKQIAEKLFISTETVKSHTKQLYAALYANNRMAAVNEARRLGLV